MRGVTAMNQYIYSIAFFLMTLSINAMEETTDPVTSPESVSESKKPVPCLFKINFDKATVEDAPNSYLIQNFERTVKEQTEKASLRLKETNKYLPSTATSIESNRCLKQAKNTITQLEQELTYYEELHQILPKLLNYLLDPHSPALRFQSISMFVPKYEFLSCTPFIDFPSLEDCHFNEDFLINYTNPTLLPAELCDIFSPLFFFYKSFTYLMELEKIQHDLFKCAKVIYHSTKNDFSNISPNFWVEYMLLSEAAKRNKKPLVDFLKERIETLVYQAEKVVIPCLAPSYMFYKVLSAFIDEMKTHQDSLKAYREEAKKG
jgi:hypothetical protein